MSKVLYTLSRVVAVIVVFNGIFTIGNYFPVSRNIFMLTELIVFLIISILYQKKRVAFTPSYLIYYFVVFFINGYFPYTYPQNKMMLGTTVRNRYARIPNDHFELLFYIVLVISFIIILYLLISRESKIVFNGIRTNNFQVKSILLAMTVLAPIQIILGGNYRKLLIPYFVFFIILFLYSKSLRKNKLFIFGLFLAIIFLMTQITWRFIAIQYLFPIILGIIMLETMTMNNKILKRYIILIILGFISILLYGIISEMYKLGAIDSVSDITKVFTNREYFDIWVERQSYRIFGIWTVLGGNIIDNALNFGYYYGLTYIKFLSNILGFDYISLPVISANFVGATYAQPGLIAEGYANFGLIGSVANFCTVFFLSEYLYIRFLKKQTALNLLLLIVPFTSIVFDGGSLNSVLFNILIILVTMWGAITEEYIFRKGEKI